MGIIERSDGYERIQWKVFAHRDELVFTLNQSCDRLFLSPAEAREIAINFLRGAEVIAPSPAMQDAIKQLEAAMPVPLAAALRPVR